MGGEIATVKEEKVLLDDKIQEIMNDNEVLVKELDEITSVQLKRTLEESVQNTLRITEETENFIANEEIMGKNLSTMYGNDENGNCNELIIKEVIDNNEN